MHTIPGYTTTDVVYQDSRVTTYRGRRDADQQPVLLKTSTAEYPSLEDNVRLKHEYRLTRSLDFDGVVAPHALENHQSRLVLVQEDFGGLPLSQVMAAGEAGLAACLRLARQLADILGRLHDRQIVHKDLHPGSIFLHPDTHRVKITNLGIASELPRENQVACSPRAIEGVLAYISPEQTGRMNRTLDYRTDYYSLGVCLYELLTGQLPFTAADPMEMVHGHIAKQPVPPHVVNPALPVSVSQVVMKLLAKTAEERYQGIRGLQADLDGCLDRGTDPPAYFVPGRHDVAVTLQLPQKLYGRTAERAALLAAFDRISEGAAEMVLVSGYAGIGKSALVHEIHKPVVRQRGYFVSGKFDQFRRNLPYSALIQAVQQLIRHLLTEGEAAIAAWKRELQEALGAVGQVVIDAIPEVELIIGPQPAIPRLGPTEAQNRFRMAFQNVLGVFTQKEHPLALFLDDLQWADAASLDLIQYLMADQSHGYLLLIGAYRDNEVGAVHPLVEVLKAVQKGGTSITRLAVHPLSLDDLNQLVADTLRCHPAYSKPLAELILRKTDGNPFFVLEFLRALYQEGLLAFDPTFEREDQVHRGGWTWDIEKIETVQTTDNVVDLMVDNMRKLVPETQAVLKLAACIGNRFDLKTLSLVYEHGYRETTMALWPAVQAGLILPEDPAYRLLQSVDLGDSDVLDEVRIPYTFLHDRVQQAAYWLIPEDQKKQIHLRIGRLLWHHLDPDQLEETLFEVAGHLNVGAELMDDPAERYEAAALNLAAGQKAKAATAYESALRFLTAGTQHLSDADWQERYDLMFPLHHERAECEYLTTRFEEADERFARLLQKARTNMDQVAVQATRMTLFLHLRKHQEALDTGLSALRLLGIHLPAQPRTPLVLAELAKVKWKLGRRSAESLHALPDRVTPEIRTAMKLLINLWFPAYLLDREALVGLIVLKTVHLSLRYGNAAPSAFAYACYGVVVSSLFGKPKAGAAYGSLALQLARRFDEPAVTSKTLFVIASFLTHFTSHATRSIEQLEEGLRCSLETGDLIQAGYCANVRMYDLCLLGTALPEVEVEAQRYREFGRRIGADEVVETMDIVLQWVAWWKDTNPATLQAEEFSFEASDEVKERDVYVLLHLQTAYMFEKYEEARDFARHLMDYPALLDPSLYTMPYHRCFYALALAALYPSATTDEKKRYRKAIKSARRTLKKWAANSPQNTRHMHLLVEAEAARLFGRMEQAATFYDQAIASAQEHSYIQYAALANERAASLYRAQGRLNIAGLYLQEAHYLYRTWGAATKAAVLEEQYPQVLTSPSAPGPEKDGATRMMAVSETAELDLTSVVKASQVLSGEIVLGQLLKRVMEIVMENAGAQRGVLILVVDDQLVIEAEGTVDRDDIQVLQSIPVEEHAALSRSIVHYVSRTNQHVVLHDADDEGLFITDPYIAQYRPHSILCTPLLKQGQLLGLLYLENDLTTGAFTPDRLEVLQMLSSQIAISIENARLYANLEQKVEARTEELRQKNVDLQEAYRHLETTQAQLIQAEKMASLGQLTAGIAHDIKNPLNFINNFAQIGADLADELASAIEAGEPDEELNVIIEELKRSAEVINNQGKRADVIVKSMMEHAQGGSGKRQATDINALVEEYFKLAYNSMQAKQPEFTVKLERSYGEPVEKVVLVPQEIGRVLINLMNNAFYAVQEKASKVKGGYVPTVRVVTEQVGDHIAIQVVDNGSGIPAKVLGKIFEPFYTTKPTGRGNTGLGLSLSYDIVTQGHGGTLTVESETGEGATFMVTLPANNRAQRR